jgi:hypothetical protein
LNPLNYLNHEERKNEDSGLLLSIDITIEVAILLDYEDYCNLILTCKTIHKWLTDERYWKTKAISSLNHNLPYSYEKLVSQKIVSKEIDINELEKNILPSWCSSWKELWLTFFSPKFTSGEIIREAIIIDEKHTNNSYYNYNLVDRVIILKNGDVLVSRFNYYGDYRKLILYSKDLEEKCSFSTNLCSKNCGGIAQDSNGYIYIGRINENTEYSSVICDVYKINDKNLEHQYTLCIDGWYDQGECIIAENTSISISELNNKIYFEGYDTGISHNLCGIYSLKYNDKNIIKYNKTYHDGNHRSDNDKLRYMDTNYLGIMHLCNGEVCFKFKLSDDEKKIYAIVLHKLSTKPSKVEIFSTETEKLITTIDISDFNLVIPIIHSFEYSINYHRKCDKFFDNVLDYASYSKKEKILLCKERDGKTIIRWIK